MNCEKGLFHFSGNVGGGKVKTFYFDDFNEFWKAVKMGAQRYFARIKKDEYTKKYREAHLETARAKAREYYWKHREQMISAGREYRKKFGKEIYRARKEREEERNNLSLENKQ
jgi:hypothetical protein